MLCNNYLCDLDSEYTYGEKSVFHRNTVRPLVPPVVFMLTRAVPEPLYPELQSEYLTR